VKKFLTCGILIKIKQLPVKVWQCLVVMFLWYAYCRLFKYHNNLNRIKMKDLLVHVSSPARSQLFMTYAAYLARDLGLSVKYLYIHSPGGPPMGMPASLNATTAVTRKEIDEDVEKAKHHLELQINKLNASDPDLPLLDYRIEVGYPPKVIHAYCSGKMIDTVMLAGAKERSFFTDDAYTVDIIRKLPCPVWVIPEGITYKSFSEILYATDYNQEDIPNLKILAKFASKFPASITAVHILKNNGFEEKVKVGGFADRIKKETGYDMISHKVLPEKTGEPLVEEIHNFALLIDADLVVLLRENRGFIDRLMHGSRSEKIARKTQLPVLIFNEARS
jgi:nucleotide-binding universal stress UspA family protein